MAVLFGRRRLVPNVARLLLSHKQRRFHVFFLNSTRARTGTVTSFDVDGNFSHKSSVMAYTAVTRPKFFSSDSAAALETDEDQSAPPDLPCRFSIDFCLWKPASILRCFISDAKHMAWLDWTHNDLYLFAFDSEHHFRERASFWDSQGRASR